MVMKGRPSVGLAGETLEIGSQLGPIRELTIRTGLEAESLLRRSDVLLR
jgi:hypothetical protein